MPDFTAPAMPADDRLYVSSGAFGSRDLPEILERARAWGATSVELSSGVRHRDDVLDVVRRHRSAFRFLVHNYFPAPSIPFALNLAAADPETLSRSREHCRAAMALAAELDTDLFSVHAGFAALPGPQHLGSAWKDVPRTPRAKALEIFQDSVAELVAYGAEIGVRLLIENNVLAPFNFQDGEHPLLGVEAEELARLAEEINSPWFGYLIDVGHLKVSATTLGFDCDRFMATAAPWIGAFHLSDNDGLTDSNQPFDETAWFMPWLARCAEVPVVLEIYGTTPKLLARSADAVVRAGWRSIG